MPVNSIDWHFYWRSLYKVLWQIQHLVDYPVGFKGQYMNIYSI